LVEAQPFADGFTHGAGGVKVKGIGFAQEEEAEDMIEIGIGEQDRLDGAVTERRTLGMKATECFDLTAQVRRGIDEKPRLPVSGKGDGRLR
jgi:hypothetical protein